MPQQIKKSLVLSIYFTLAVSTLLVFWQVRNFDFINYDDNVYVYENPHVLNGITIDAVSWAFTTGQATNWHPLTWLSLMLDCQLFGPDPGRIHLVNVLIHIVNTLLLFALLKKMTNALWPSAFVAAVFAIHPMHVESVAWIAERKDVLSALFWLLTMGAYLAYVRHPGAFRYTMTLVLFALGLLTKPMLVTLPFVLLLLDYWPLGRFAAPRTVRIAGGKSRNPVPIHDGLAILYRMIIEKIPFFILVVISSVITFLVQRSGEAVKNITLEYRAANILTSYVEYISKMFWPWNLAVFYPLKAAASFLFWQVAACALLLLVISIFVIRFGRNQKYLPVGWFWFVGTLIPVIGIVQVGLQAYADRYTYISYIGLFIMIAWGLPELLSKWTSASSVESPQRKIALGLSMVIVLTTLGVCAHRQAGFWKNSFTLFSHAIEVTQNNYIAHYSLGNAYDSLGRFQQAIDEHNQAIKLEPGLAMAHYNLGNAYRSLGRYQDAIDAYKQAIRIKPDYAEAHNNLGVAYGNLGHWPEAIDAFKQAIRIKPDYTDAHYNLGAAYGKLGRWQDAIDTYKQAIRINPDDAEAHYNLGLAYLAIGDKNSALAEYNILKSLNLQFANDLLKEINK